MSGERLLPHLSSPMDEGFGKSAMIQMQTKRKGIGTRTWLIVSESGHSHTEEVEKHSIMRRTGLHARDLRVLDPVLSYPSTILGRERAIVVNLEHIKAIITAAEVLMINSNSPLAVQFVRDIQHRVSAPSCVPQQVTEGNFSGEDEPIVGDAKTVPFEFRALEACLESACRCLEAETHTLEEEAYPALDELTSKISTLNLERVRQIKSRLVAISGRVQKVRDELEHLLDDDNDMAEMYLTEKLVSRSLDNTSSKEGIDNAVYEEASRRGEDSESESDVGDEESGDDISVKLNVEELEMLLEAYFAQIDGILQKLSTMNDYVDDTEDCINIMLDDKQNQLLQMGVLLSTANMIINAGIVVVGVFGMNISIELFDAEPIKFWQTVAGTIGGCIALYTIAVGWGKKRNLIAL